MKRLIVLLFLLFVPFGFLIAQEQGGATQQDAAEPQGAVGGQGKSTDDPYGRFSHYAPTTDRAAKTKPQTEEEDYKVIQRMLEDSKKVYAPILTSYLDNGALFYYKSVVREPRKYRFKEPALFYDSAVSSINQTSKLGENIDFLKRGLTRFTGMREVLEAMGKDKEELNNVDFDLHYTLGILLAYRGQVSDLKDAKKNFQYVVEEGDALSKDKPITEDKTKLEGVYTALIGVNRRLMDKDANETWKREYLKDELFYLWKLTDVVVDSDPVKQIRLTRLAKDYLDIIDLAGQRYANYYKPYVEKMTASELGRLNKVNEIENSKNELLAAPKNGVATPTPVSKGAAATPPKDTASPSNPSATGGAADTTKAPTTTTP